MYKNCNGCKAYESISYSRFGGRASSNPVFSCSLGYSQVDGIPQEECPKPMTTILLVDMLTNILQNSEKEQDNKNVRL